MDEGMNIKQSVEQEKKEILIKRKDRKVVIKRMDFGQEYRKTDIRNNLIRKEV